MNDAPMDTLAHDTAFARAFERGEVGNDSFRHREHLRLAWACLAEAPSTEAACARVGAAIRAFAQRAGNGQRYHETLTQFWVRLLAGIHAGVRAAACDATGFDDVLAAHPWLLDKDLPLAYYTRALLFGDAARAAWRPPDLRPLPSHAPAADPRAPPRHA
jgi:hypothetical protein